MGEEGVEQEIAWGHYVIGDRISGLTREMVTEYIRYLGNLRWTSLGFEPVSYTHLALSRGAVNTNNSGNGRSSGRKGCLWNTER